jgi:hypothetical protein
LAGSDRGDAGRVGDWGIPSIASRRNDRLLTAKDPVQQLVLAEKLPDILDRVSSGDLGGSGSNERFSSTRSLPVACQLCAFTLEGPLCYGDAAAFRDCQNDHYLKYFMIMLPANGFSQLALSA